MFSSIFSHIAVYEPENAQFFMCVSQKLKLYYSTTLHVVFLLSYRKTSFAGSLVKIKWHFYLKTFHFHRKIILPTRMWFLFGWIFGWIEWKKRTKNKSSSSSSNNKKNFFALFYCNEPMNLEKKILFICVECEIEMRYFWTCFQTIKW